MTTATNAPLVTIPGQFSEAELAALILSATMINFWDRLPSRTTPGRRI